MRRRPAPSILVAVTALVAPALGIVTEFAAADPVTWPTNGHQYEVLSNPAGVTWQQAYDDCLSRGGYLATSTSSAENAFLFGLVSGRPELWYIDGAGNGIGPWLGGMQPTGSPEPGGGWTWVSGEPWSFMLWASGEPNNWGGSEERLCFFGFRTLTGDRWNDMPQTALSRSWVLEIPVAARTCSTWATNGHRYQLVRTPGGVSWEWANASAAAFGGHLATIGSAEENAFVAAIAMADPTVWRIDPAGNGQGPWIGGLQPAGSPEPAGGWTWETGEPWSYTHWAPFEPNNLNGVEDRLQLFGRGTLTGDFWNDMLNNTPYGGLAYVVEFESGGGDCVESVGVPEHGAAGLEFAGPAPNPVRGGCLLPFTLPAPGSATLEIYGVRGERLRTVVAGWLTAGRHAPRWDGLDSRGRPLPAGVYLVSLHAGAATATRRMIVLGR